VRFKVQWAPSGTRRLSTVMPPNSPRQIRSSATAVAGSNTTLAEASSNPKVRRAVSEVKSQSRLVSENPDRASLHDQDTLAFFILPLDVPPKLSHQAQEP
jgi:hypothetical protein